MGGRKSATHQTRSKKPSTTYQTPMGGRKSANHQTPSKKPSTSHKYNRKNENARKSTTNQTPRSAKEPAINKETINRMSKIQFF
jgi:hypothetical protein